MYLPSLSCQFDYLHWYLFLCTVKARLLACFGNAAKEKATQITIFLFLLTRLYSYTVRLFTKVNNFEQNYVAKIQPNDGSAEQKCFGKVIYLVYVTTVNLFKAQDDRFSYL